MNKRYLKTIRKADGQTYAPEAIPNPGVNIPGLPSQLQPSGILGTLGKVETFTGTAPTKTDSLSGKTRQEINVENFTNKIGISQAEAIKRLTSLGMAEQDAAKFLHDIVEMAGSGNVDDAVMRYTEFYDFVNEAAKLAVPSNASVKDTVTVAVSLYIASGNNKQSAIETLKELSEEAGKNPNMDLMNAAVKAIQNPGDTSWRAKIMEVSIQESLLGEDSDRSKLLIPKMNSQLAMIFQLLVSPNPELMVRILKRKQEELKRDKVSEQLMAQVYNLESNMIMQRYIRQRQDYNNMKKDITGWLGTGGLTYLGFIDSYATMRQRIQLLGEALNVINVKAPTSTGKQSNMKTKLIRIAAQPIPIKPTSTTGNISVNSAPSVVSNADSNVSAVETMKTRSLTTDTAARDIKSVFSSQTYDIYRNMQSLEMNYNISFKAADRYANLISEMMGGDISEQVGPQAKGFHPSLYKNNMQKVVPTGVSGTGIKNMAVALKTSLNNAEQFFNTIVQLTNNLLSYMNQELNRMPANKKNDAQILINNTAAMQSERLDEKWKIENYQNYADIALIAADDQQIINQLIFYYNNAKSVLDKVTPQFNYMRAGMMPIIISMNQAMIKIANKYKEMSNKILTTGRFRSGTFQQQAKFWADHFFIIGEQWMQEARQFPMEQMSQFLPGAGQHAQQFGSQTSAQRKLKTLITAENSCKIKIDIKDDKNIEAAGEEEVEDYWNDLYENTQSPPEPPYGEEMIKEYDTQNRTPIKDKIKERQLKIVKYHKSLQ